ncbi:MAG: HigA family addiction module antitoxin [Geminicoccaceae bacterium]
MPMYDPPHPGEIVREDCLKPLGLTVTEAAKVLRVSRQTLSEIVNCRAGITPDMAIRLSMAFGSSAKVWLGLQTKYDLQQAEKRNANLDIERYQPA